MKKSKTLRLNFAVAVLLVLFLIFSSSYTSNTAYAAFTPDAKFETQNVMVDLEGSVINDATFNISDYPLNEKGEMQILTFLEYCYSYRTSLQNNYALYVYIYNPQGLNINVSSSLNKIQLRFGGKETDNYEKFSLKYLNKCELSGKEGLFYKFKVNITSAQKKTILSKLNMDGRIYEVSGFEISTTKEYKEYKCTLKYVYTGYALGYGPESAKKSTLSSSTSGITDYISIEDIGFTYYRPEGTNGEEFKQDSLHTVYFAVPNDYINKYGEMTAVHASWYNAVLRPILVTGNAEAYNAFKSWLGKEWTFDRNIGLMYLGGATVSNADFTSHWNFGYYLNCLDGGYYDGIDGNASYYNSKYGGAVNPLYYMFYAGEGENSADTFRISSKQLTEKLKNSFTEFGGTAVCDNYSDKIFESYDKERVDLNIERDDKYELTSQTFSKNWFQEIFGGKSLEGTTISKMNAIEAVTADSVKGTTDEVVKRLYIADSDYSYFMEYYNKYKSNSTVYLFRYMKSEYICEEASLVKPKGLRIDTNAYFFQETVNLNFDIIDLTFTLNGVKTVIPVVMTPIDIIHEGTPPVETHDDSKENDWLKKLLMIVALIILIIVLAPVLPYILKGIVWVLMLPVRFIYWIVKIIKANKRNKNE